MVTCCCAVNCPNRQNPGCNLHFYKIPSKKTPFEEKRRADWIQALRRDEWKTWSYEKISKQYVCSAHFISGERSEVQSDPDWAPSIFSFNKHDAYKAGLIQRQKNKRHETIQNKRFPLPLAKQPKPSTSTASVADIPTPTDNSIAVQVDNTSREIEELKHKLAISENNNKILKAEIDKLTIENDQLREKSRVFGFNQIKTDDLISFFTGLPTLSVFLWLVSVLKLYMKESKSKGVSIQNQVLIVLMKLRLGLLHKDLGFRFNLAESTISTVIRQTLPIMSNVLRNLIIWPTRADVRRNLPKSFRKNYRDALCIIDCSEVFIERPSNLTARAQTWSSYKHHNTIKYLIGITPAGAVMFLSAGWGGRASDKKITNESGFLDQIRHGDCILADRGFLISQELNERGATLKIPAFTKGKSLSKKQTHHSGHLSSVRIHVERVIGRMKDFRIMQSTIPITMVDLLDHMMVVVSACVNLNKSVVPR